MIPSWKTNKKMLTYGQKNGVTGKVVSLKKLMSKRMKMYKISEGNALHSYVNLLCVHMHMCLEFTLMYINSGNTEPSKIRPVPSGDFLVGKRNKDDN